MTKKIALVDIDGCILQGNKLNQALVEQLREFDEIILFTQRSIFLQRAQITRRYLMDTEAIQPDDLVNTPDVVRALGDALQKPIKVSTSVDQFHGVPTQYYETTLKPFEETLKGEASKVKQGEQFNLSEKLLQQYNEETAMVWSGVKKLDSMNENDPSSYYPKGKVEQYDHVYKALPGMLGTWDFQVTYFDDSLNNLTEVQQGVENKVPQCVLVNQSYICPVSQYVELHGQVGVDKEKLQGDPVAQLHNYVALRAEESRLSGSEYNSNWARFFTPNAGSASTKIRAANKAIKILQGYDDPKYTLTEKELEALQQGRLKSAVGLKLDAIKNVSQPTLSIVPSPDFSIN